MIRTFSSASAKLTKINLRSFELPMINSRCSPSECDVSSKMRASGSANTETASSNVTPCFAQLDSAFCGSQLNRRGILKKWYHGIDFILPRKIAQETQQGGAEYPKWICPKVVHDGKTGI